VTVPQTGAAHRTFCTYFDRNYLSRGLALYRSLDARGGSFTLHILCLDDEARETLAALRLPHARLISLSDFEDPELLRAKANRATIEYYWTLTPSLPLYVLRQDQTVDVITYVDADLFFFAEPSALFEEMGDASVMIQPHRFPPRLADRAANGIYNVGWVTFRRDDVGLACATRWREQCIEWCYYRVEDGKLGDQKYLDTWTTDYPSVHVMQHLGGGLAPWNIEQYRIHLDRASRRVMVDELPVIFFHFHGMQLYDDGRVERAPSTYTLRSEDVDLIYKPYERALGDARAEIVSVNPGYRYSVAGEGSVSAMDMLTGTNAPGRRSLRDVIGALRRHLLQHQG
jgi:hypothetical protein